MQINDKVPEMVLDAFHEGKFVKIDLASYRKKWLVLFFYPADFTFVCPTELEELADHYSEFKKLGAEVLAVSTDTMYVHKAWHASSPAIKKIQFPMVADPTGKLSKACGTYIDSEGLSLRGTFLIDPDGLLSAYEVHNNNIGRSAKELIRKLQAAIFVREHDGMVCPASWAPGKEAIKV